MSAIPLLDLKPQHEALREELLRAFARVLDANRFILGEEVESFEGELAEYLGVRQVVAVSSGSDALLLCLMAQGVGPGDEVITTPFTFFATLGCILRLGATPVFADIEASTFNLDPEKAAACRSAATRAALPVHLFGRPATLPHLEGVAIFEDAAQSIGASPLQGRAGCLSFFPSKNLGGMGDGGAIYTNDEDLARDLRLLRAHGASPKYIHHRVGGNFRLDALQAALLRIKLRHLPKWTAMRRQIAMRYHELFAARPELQVELVLPEIREKHVVNQFVIRSARRDALRQHLQAQNIGTEVYYPLAMHLQPCMSGRGHAKGDFPEAERACEEVLALPCFPGLTPSAQERVVETIAEFFA